MDPETKKLLEENIEIGKSNNEMLVKLVKAQQRANIIRMVYWGLIIFFSFGAYYLIQPFLDNLLNVYTGGMSGTSSVTDVLKNFSDKGQIQDLIDSIK